MAVGGHIPSIVVAVVEGGAFGCEAVGAVGYRGQVYYPDEAIRDIRIVKIDEVIDQVKGIAGGLAPKLVGHAHAEGVGEVVARLGKQ